MAEKRKTKLGDGSSILLKLLLLIPTALRVVSNVTFLIKKQSYTAGKNIILMVILAILFACLLSSTWVGFLLFLFFFLLHLQWNWMVAALVVLLGNLLLLFIISLAICRMRNQMFSHKIRETKVMEQ